MITYYEAVPRCFKPEVYKSLKCHASPPELLRLAVWECFLHTQDEEVEDVIKYEN